MNNGFRSADEEAMVGAARERAQRAYAELDALVHEAHRCNVALVQKGLTPIVVGQYSPPPAPASGAQVIDVVRAYDGGAQWYAAEAGKLGNALATVRGELAQANAPPAQLAPGPRRVPLAMAFAELTRTPWVVLRVLLFPPFTMIALVATGALATVAPELAAGVLVAALALVWALGLRAGLRRVRLLAAGEVGQVFQRVERRAGGRNRNVPMLRARGWKIEVESYTGPSRTTEFVVQNSRGATVSVSVSHGHPFDGVVLVDPERGYGCANIDFGSCPAPDASGQWSGALSMRTWVTATLGLIMSGAVVTAAAALLAGFQIIG